MPSPRRIIAALRKRTERPTVVLLYCLVCQRMTVHRQSGSPNDFRGCLEHEPA